MKMKGEITTSVEEKKEAEDEHEETDKVNAIPVTGLGGSHTSKTISSQMLVRLSAL
jgi:hypothetical protein